MKFTLSWLKEHLETKANTAEISDRLTMLGLEVEKVWMPDSILDDLVVARVTHFEQHPLAEKLKICQVDTGTEILQVVCGAPNVCSGMKALLARPGVIIPSTGKRLQKSSIRGVESQGMLCSTRELNLGEDSTSIVALPLDTLIGISALDALMVEPVFDVVITPDRADCLCVRGIARDLAASGLGSLKEEICLHTPGTFTSPITVIRPQKKESSIESTCPLFVGRFLRGVRNNQSPHWLQRRLIAAGLKPMSTLVDVTNLICFDIGRPLHVFDADKLTGSLTIRLSLPGEEFISLNNKEYSLPEHTLVVADDAGPQALAGLIGGLATACSETTTNVFLESALFNPIQIARSGQTLAIESEARQRFERGVDPAAVITGIEKATHLILELCGGEASQLVISGTEPTWQRTILLRVDRFYRLSGFELSVSTLKGLLEAIGCSVEIIANTLLAAIPPSWRHDLSTESDLVGEIIRLYGYDQVPTAALPYSSIPSLTLSEAQKKRFLTRRALASRGMLESITWSFIPVSDAIKFGGGTPNMTIVNPISTELSALRPSLLPGLIAAVSRNLTYGTPNVSLFEIGHQFHDSVPGAQKLVAAGVRAGYASSRHWAMSSPRVIDVFDVKADALAVLAFIVGSQHVSDIWITHDDAPTWYHPKCSGTFHFNSATMLGWFGAIHPGIAQLFGIEIPIAGFEVFLDTIVTTETTMQKKPFLKRPLLQPVVRDFSFIVDDSITADVILKAAHSVDVDETLITEVQVFDVYRSPEKPGYKSLAISVTLQPLDKTLTDQVIEAVSGNIINAVTLATGASLRTENRG